MSKDQGSSDNRSIDRNRSREGKMESSLPVSKIIPSHLPRILQQHRLVQRLQQNKDKKLVLILGRAAQCKSTLTVSCVQSDKVPTAWMNVDPEDSDPAKLFHTLAHPTSWRS